MHRLLKILNADDFITEIVGDRGLRLHKQRVSSKLGMPGLTKLVEAALGEPPRLDEAYGFVIRNKNLVKILTWDEISMNLLELYDGKADAAKKLFVEMGLMKRECAFWIMAQCYSL